MKESNSWSRWVFKVDQNGYLTDVAETRDIVKTAAGAAVDGEEIDAESYVSMNMWGLTPEFLAVLEKEFMEFFEQTQPANPLKAEYLLPVYIGQLLCENKVSVKVLETADKWFPIFVIMLIFFRYEHYIYNSGITLWISEFGWIHQLEIDIYRYAIGFIGSIVIAAVVVWNMKHMPDRLIKVLTDSGKKSMQLYIFQCFGLSFVWSRIWSKIVEKIGYNPLVTNAVMYWLITFIMACGLLLMLLFIIRILNKMPRLHKVLFGR